MLHPPVFKMVAPAEDRRCVRRASAGVVGDSTHHPRRQTVRNVNRWQSCPATATARVRSRRPARSRTGRVPSRCAGRRAGPSRRRAARPATGFRSPRTSPASERRRRRSTRTPRAGSCRRRCRLDAVVAVVGVRECPLLAGSPVPGPAAHRVAGRGRAVRDVEHLAALAADDAAVPAGASRHCWQVDPVEVQIRMFVPSAVPQPARSRTLPLARLVSRDQPSVVGVTCHCWHVLSSHAHCRTSVPSAVPQFATSSTLLLDLLTSR